MPMIDVYATEGISTASGANNYVRVQVLTPAGVLDRDKQLTESPEGGWGIAGHANTQADIAAAAAARVALSAAG
jgi:hypothetical protein